MRFKCHNTTILLLVSPNDPFDSIRETLLNALKSRGIKEINSKPVPEDASGIEFGVPLDKNNLEKGWTRLEIPEGDEKGRSSGKGKKSIFNAGPQGAELKDSQALAFRFREAGAGDMEVDDPGWDVLIPSYDDDDEEAE